MTARGNSIRDICSITGYSKDKVQAALHRSEHEIEPTQKHYDVLQMDKFHTFVGHKKNNMLITRKQVKWLPLFWGKRDLKTTFEWKQRLKEQNITHDCIASDHWQSFDTVFADANERWIGKQHTQAIEGNHCAIRHRISRAVRKNCCFSKLLFYHIKVFNIGFAYINACHWRKRRKNRI